MVMNAFCKYTVKHAPNYFGIHKVPTKPHKVPAVFWRKSIDRPNSPLYNTNLVKGIFKIISRGNNRNWPLHKSAIKWVLLYVFANNIDIIAQVTKDHDSPVR